MIKKKGPQPSTRGPALEPKMQCLITARPAPTVVQATIISVRIATMTSCPPPASAPARLSVCPPWDNWNDLDSCQIMLNPWPKSLGGFFIFIKLKARFFLMPSKRAFWSAFPLGAWSHLLLLATSSSAPSVQVLLLLVSRLAYSCFKAFALAVSSTWSAVPHVYILFCHLLCFVFLHYT